MLFTISPIVILLLCFIGNGATISYPSARFGQAMVMISDKLYMFGGTGFVNDTIGIYI